MGREGKGGEGWGNRTEGVFQTCPPPQRKGRKGRPDFVFIERGKGKNGRPAGPSLEGFGRRKEEGEEPGHVLGQEREKSSAHFVSHAFLIPKKKGERKRHPSFLGKAEGKGGWRFPVKTGTLKCAFHSLEGKKRRLILLPMERGNGIQVINSTSSAGERKGGRLPSRKEKERHFPGFSPFPLSTINPSRRKRKKKGGRGFTKEKEKAGGRRLSLFFPDCRNRGEDLVRCNLRKG